MNQNLESKILEKMKPISKKFFLLRDQSMVIAEILLNTLRI